MKIDYLAEHQDFIPTLSKWFLREWRDFYGDKTWETVAEMFYERLNRAAVPLSLIAFEDDYPLGTISLLQESISTYKHLSPWLGGLYVREERRREGIGRRLIEAGAEEARKSGAEQIYIGIRRSEDFYKGFGWQTVDRTFYHDENITIMRFDLRPSET